jgi:VIT1/CCC1 family predicted Fe2+/Mn2+ transporter
MKTLKQTLLEYQNKIIANVQGGDTVAPAIISKEEFKNALQPIRDRNLVFLWINVIMLLIVFAGSIFLVYYFIHKDKLQLLVTIFSVSGISIAGLIYYMTYLWRQIVGINITIAMLDRLDGTQIYAIITGLLSTVKKDN